MANDAIPGYRYDMKPPIRQFRLTRLISSLNETMLEAALILLGFTVLYRWHHGIKSVPIGGTVAIFIGSAAIVASWACQRSSAHIDLHEAEIRALELAGFASLGLSIYLLVLSFF